MNWAELLLGGAGGGIIGAIGSFVNRWQESKSALAVKKLEVEKDLRLAELELSTLEMRLTHTETVQAMQNDLVFDKNASEDFVASQQNDKATYATVDVRKASPWLVAVDVIRGLMRPGLTVALTAINAYLAITLIGVLHDNFNVAESLAASCSTLAGMSISWWFGARSHVGK